MKKRFVEIDPVSWGGKEGGRGFWQRCWCAEGRIMAERTNWGLQCDWNGEGCE